MYVLISFYQDKNIGLLIISQDLFMLTVHGQGRHEATLLIQLIRVDWKQLEDGKTDTFLTEWWEGTLKGLNKEPLSNTCKDFMVISSL